jgi:hypothetical protein
MLKNIFILPIEEAKLFDKYRKTSMIYSLGFEYPQIF